MTASALPTPAAHTSSEVLQRARSDPAYAAFLLLRIGFTVLPIVFGLDKFTNVFTNWEGYLAPWIVDMSPIGAHQVMLVVGVIEIVAGLAVAIKPRYAAYIVAAWLAGIIINLLSYPGFYDIALRDFGLLLAALTLGRLAFVYDPAYAAFLVLRIGFTVLPIVFGLDKFTNVLTKWEVYLAPWIVDMSPISAHQVMLVVGVIEIAAGVAVAIKPRYAAYIVAAWLAGIIFNLLSYPGFYDVALRDVGLLLAALTLGGLASVYDPAWHRRTTSGTDSPVA